MGQHFTPHAPSFPCILQLGVLSEAKETGWSGARAPVRMPLHLLLGSDLTLGLGSLKGSAGGLFPAAWIALVLPAFLHKIKKTDLTPRKASGFRTQRQYRTCPSFTNVLPVQPLTRKTTSSAAQLPSEYPCPPSTLPNYPKPSLPQPQLHLPPTHLILFLAPAFSFHNIVMRS